MHVKPDANGAASRKALALNGCAGGRDEPKGMVSLASAREVPALAHAAEIKAISLGNGKRAGYAGESCTSCGSIRVRRNGTCVVCEDCGTTSGCS